MKCKISTTLGLPVAWLANGPASGRECWVPESKTKYLAEKQLGLAAKEHLWAAMIFLLLCGAAGAQDRVLVIGGTPKYDMQQTFGLSPTTTAEATEEVSNLNRTKLQTRIDAQPANMQHPWYWPSAKGVLTHTGYRRYNFDNTLVIPPGQGGRTWIGQGWGTSQGAGNLYTPTLQLDAAKTYVKTTFEGTDLSELRSAGASNVVTVIGREVDEDLDVDGSIFISEGTTATSGWYGIGTGPTVVANGDFKNNASTGTLASWALSGGATYFVSNVGSASQIENVRTTSGAGTCSQNTTCLSGYLYTVTYTVSSTAGGGTVRVSLGGTNGTLRTANGTYTEDIYCGAGASAPVVFTFGGGGSATCTIDNVSVGSAAVDVVNNRWGLDRNWCTAAVDNGEGNYCPDMIRDYAKGNVYESIRFFGSSDESNVVKARVGLHCYGNPGGAGVNTSKTVVDKCMFDNFEVAILAGRTLAEWTSNFDTNPESADCFAGSNDNNGDHIDCRNLFLADCKVGLLTRSSQSVGHTLDVVYAEEVETVISADAGGKIYVNKLHLQGPSPGLPYHRILRVGRAVGESVGAFTFRDTSIDASCHNPQLVVSDWASTQSGCSVVFDGIKIQRHNNSTLPLVDIHGGISLTLANVSLGDSGNKGRLMAGDLRLSDGGGGTKAHVVIRDSWIGVTDPKTLINSSSTAGHIIDFVGVKLLDSTVLPNGRLVTGAGGTSTWVESVQRSVFISPDLDTTAMTTGDGKGVYFRVPAKLNGYNLTGVAASCNTASSSGIPTFQLRRKRAGADVDMLSDKVTIDANETDSSTAAEAAAVNPTNDDVATGDRIYFDCDVAGTGTEGVAIDMTFQRP